MLVSIARAGLPPHALRAAIVLAVASVVGYSARSGASSGPSASSGDGIAAHGGPGFAADGARLPGAAVTTNPASAVPSGPVLLDAVDVRPSPNPLRGVAPAELDRFALTPPATLGSVCVGRPNRGRLFNAVPLHNEPGLRLMGDESNHFGTAETVSTLRAAVAEFRAAHPEAPALNVGDLSRARGGYLRPHRSHQMGVDADLGYFYRESGKWYEKANAENLDRKLTWAFLKSLIAQGNVEYVFMDRSIQALLEEYARDIGESPAFLETLFETPAHRDTLIRHAHGHVTHFHVRFSDPAALRVGSTLDARLRRRGRR